MTTKEYKEYYESKTFKEKYVYEGNDLGAACTKQGICFKLWSPFAEDVAVNLYKDGESRKFTSYPMVREEKGVWSCMAAGVGHGTYYDFTLEMNGETVKSYDPWARACNCNGGRSMAVDLSKTNPEGWETDRNWFEVKNRKETNNTAYGVSGEQIIYEIHVKDFSYDKASGVPEAYRGKYKAFTLEGMSLRGEGRLPTCLDYLKELGITHVQLLPVYDYGSVDESGASSQFNWGYDPKNYNVPEGSYSTDPYNGEVRIRELKELIQSLHKHGIGVIMDVVYNHTYSLDSCFTRTAPYYYYRQNEDGSYSNGSDCGNDVACEREMCRKYILDSVLYWAEEYHMDGFRFDLMGLLDVGLLNDIRKALDEIYGKGRILVYGEPWSAADSPMAAGYVPCKKDAINLLDENVGVFCDNTRDAVKGHVFYEEVPGFVNGGTGLETDILRSVTGCVSGTIDKEQDLNSAISSEFPVKAPSQIINYISAHDNMTLWDKLMVTMKPGQSFDTKDEEVIRAYKMAAAVYFTCQGRLFFLGGEESARTKYGDANSYKSPPEVNQIDWRRAYEYEEILEYYKGLIAFRKQMSGLTDKSAAAYQRVYDQAIPAPGVVTFCVRNNDTDKWKELFICYNSTEEGIEIWLPKGGWELLLDETSSVLWKQGETVEGSQVIAPVSVKIFGKR